MKLPHWLPSPARSETQNFTNSVLIVDVDGFHRLTYDQVVFVFVGLIRAGHSLSLKEDNRKKYENQ